MSTEKVYAPGTSVKSRKTDFGEVLRLSINLEKFGPFCKENKNQKGWINLEIIPRKETGQYGETHSVKLDTWEPQNNGGSDTAPAKKAAAPKKEVAADTATDDIPF